MNFTEPQAELNVSWDLLRTFLLAASARTFGAAAAQRRLTVSAISQQMKALEAALGLPLFERVGRNVRLTADGQRLWQRLQPAAATLTEALHELSERYGQVAGQVAVGSPRGFGGIWLRPRLPRLLAAHPALQLSVDFDVPSVLERRLVEGALDLCILGRPSELPGVSTQPIATETFIAVASPALARQHRDFAQARYLVFDDDLPMLAPWWRASFGRSAKLQPQIAARVASLDELQALAEAGAGVAVLPDYFVADAVKARRLVKLATPGRPATNTLFLAWRSHAVATARFLSVKAALAGPVVATD